MNVGRPILVALWALLAASGCASYQPISPAAAVVAEEVEPGDTVRVRTAEHGELTMLVTAVSDRELRGRIGRRADSRLTLGLDRIELLEIRRLSMRRTLLSVVVPVVAATIAACSSGDCRTTGALDASF